MSHGLSSRVSEAGRIRPFSRGTPLRVRAEMVQAIRSYFVDEGFLEVETPLLIPAPAPETHVDALRVGGRYLHTSPELCMKRLLARGHTKIFQIGKCFRQGERGRLHLPEFTLLEWYEAGIDYRAMMETCEAMILRVARSLGRGEMLSFHGSIIRLDPPWERLSVEEAFERYASLDLWEALEHGAFDEVLVGEVEPRLGIDRPTFLHDYPAPLAALARLRRDDPRVAERFELYLGGVEIANAFSELTDPKEQKERFLRDSEERRVMGKEVYPTPESFLEALEHMPDAAGIALGVDRLAMIFTDSPSVDEVVAFLPEDA